jgi:hypothetical protein
VLAGVSRPTVDLWLDRYAREGVAGLLDRPRGAGREQVPTWIRRVLALSREGPPVETGLSHWSSRELARFEHAHRGGVGVAFLRGQTVAGEVVAPAPAWNVQAQPGPGQAATASPVIRTWGVVGRRRSEDRS